jgi:hypothetical protein
MTDSHIKINDSQPRVSHTADGVATAFAAPFPFLSGSDLSVWVDSLLMANGTNYLVTGAGESAGGSVAFVTAPVAGSTIVVARQMGIARTSDFLAGSAMRAAALNTELDRLTMVSQELEAADERALRASSHDTGALAELPVTPDRAGRLLSFDVNGDPEAGPLRSAVDRADQIAGAEANAVAAATSAEAAAAVVAAQVAAVDAGELQANQQAAMHAAPHVLPVTFPGVAVLANHRRNLVFSPGASPELHTYRTTDSGAWHLNASSANEQWFDLSHMGIGQEFRAAVRHGGTGSIVIDPGVDNAGNANLIGPFSAGQKVRIFPGEAVVIIARSNNNDGGFIGEAAVYSANPQVNLIGSAHRLTENAFGLYDGDSVYNLFNEFEGINLPAGYSLDSAKPNFSYPLLSFAVNGAGDVIPPRIQIPDREYTISVTGGAFQIGETVNASGGGVLRVDYLRADSTKIGLDLQSGSVPVSPQTLTGVSSAATANVTSAITIADLPGDAIALMIHNPVAGSADLRVHWRNLEKI